MSQRELFEISYEEFYRQQRADHKFATSQPSPNDFIEAFRPVIEAGDEIICILISSGISGSLNSASLAVQLLDTDRISIFDSYQSGFNQASLALKARELAETGMDRAQILAALTDMRGRSKVYFIVESLRYLYEGGRLNGAQALIGSVIQIKPIIWFDSAGKMTAFEKIRTLSNAKKRVLELVNTSATDHGIERIGLHYGDNYQEAVEYAQVLEAAAGVPVTLMRLSPVIATHTGPDILGACYTSKK